MSKLKPQGWDQLTRREKIAAVMYPSLTPKALQDEMRTIARGEGKGAGLERRMRTDGGKAVVPGKFDNVPGLRRK